MVKRGEIKNISKVLDDVLSQKQFRIGIDNLKVQEAWIKTMGKNIQKYTYTVKYKKGVLFIKLKSSVLKEELTFEKRKVINLINKEFSLSTFSSTWWSKNYYVHYYLPNFAFLINDSYCELINLV